MGHSKLNMIIQMSIFNKFRIVMHIFGNYCDILNIGLQNFKIEN